MDAETIKKAKQQYEKAEKGKKALKTIFGKEIFSSHMPTTFEQACEFNGVTPDEIIPFKTPKNGDEEAINAFARLIQTSKAIKNKKKLDYDNSDQKKIFPVFDLRSPAGFGFCFTTYVWARASTTGGPRLSFFTEEEVMHSVKYFEHDWEKMIVE
jgi:hypothetical protein